MKNIPSLVLIVALSAAAHGAAVPPPPAKQQAVEDGKDLPAGDVKLDLGGKTLHAVNWTWPGWSGYYMSVSNGTLSVTGNMHPRHGTTDILAGGTLRFEDGSSYIPGLNDAQPRTTRVLRGGTLDLSHGTLAPFNSRFFMDEGSRVLLGVDLRPTRHGHKWRAKGGRLVITDHVDLNMNEFFVDTNAVLTVEIAEGTSLMCLESGSSGTQAHQHSWGVPKERKKSGYGYDDDPPRRYRETIRKCYRFIKENPRAKGTPETKIALGLGCNDGYIGYNTVPWAQHVNNASHTNGPVRIWGASHPEQTWDRARRTFFPGSGTRGVDGMPYGQVDVVGIDDQTRLSDIERYSMIAFGGWNTMTPHAKDLLEKWMAKGGDCVLCLPQCLTRDDRNFVDYGIEDLLVPAGIKVAGFEKADGVEVARLAPGSKAEAVETTGNSGVPLVVRVPVGKGSLHLMLGKRFPGGDNRLGGAWQKLLADRASKVAQSLALEQANPDDQLRFFVAAAYDDCAYVLNLDMHKERKVAVRLDGKTQELALAPLEMKSLPRRGRR